MDAVTRVPLDRQSTARLFFGFVVRVVLPAAAVTAFIAYCFFRSGHSFVDWATHIPVP
jgi:hypothetical protein